MVEAAGANTLDLYFHVWNVVEERLNGATTADVQYIWSPVYVNALVLRDRSTLHKGTLDERLWVQQDANWNVTALLDNSANVVERYIYDAYGQATNLNASWSTLGSSAYDSRVLFQGERIDLATGLYHMDHREYSASLGRWISVDPEGFNAGNNNFYGFVENNPEVNRDPSGLTDWWFLSPIQTAKDILNWGGEGPAEHQVGEEVRQAALRELDQPGGVWPEDMSRLEKLRLTKLPIAKKKLPFHYQYGANPGLEAQSHAAKRAVEIWGPDGEFWQVITIIGSAFVAGFPGLGPKKGASRPPQPNRPVPAQVEGGIKPVRPLYPRSPSQPPCPGFECRVNVPKGSSQGSSYNPTTGDSLHPDLHHPGPIGPHYDYTDPSGKSFRL